MHVPFRPHMFLFYLFSYVFIYLPDLRQTFCLGALKLPAYCDALDLCSHFQPLLIFSLCVWYLDLFGFYFKNCLI